jgi:hypothetical protein
VITKIVLNILYKRKTPERRDELCSHLTVSDALAQGSPDFSGWHAAMAMANLAEEEIRANEQKAVAEHNVKIAQHPVVITEENKEYHNKKDTAE